jgi:hypothetical protein
VTTFEGRPQWLRVGEAWVRVEERGASHFGGCGHPRTRANTYVGRYQTWAARQCRTCALRRAKARYQPHPRSDGRFCQNGHERTPQNVYAPGTPTAGRCRPCAINRARRQREREKEIRCAA